MGKQEKSEGLMPLDQFVPNDKNPRFIKDFRYAQLKRSLSDFPEMLEARPVIIDENNIILGGNMRYKAAEELGIKKLPYKRVTGWTEEQKREFVIKDNLNYGDWDHDELAANFEILDLETWGVDLPVLFDESEIDLSGSKDGGEEKESNYTKKIESPIYKPNQDTPPDIKDLYDASKSNKLLSNIDSLDASQDVKDFLKFAAYRHIKFNYKNIAEFYCHQKKDVQAMMEESALVIIDFDKAIENGFFSLS